jgi:hypothetical protein
VISVFTTLSADHFVIDDFMQTAQYFKLTDADDPSTSLWARAQAAVTIRRMNRGTIDRYCHPTRSP